MLGNHAANTHASFQILPSFLKPLNSSFPEVSAEVSLLRCLPRGASAETPHFYANFREMSITPLPLDRFIFKNSGFILYSIMHIQAKFQGSMSKIVCSGSFLSPEALLRFTRGTPGHKSPSHAKICELGNIYT